VRRIRARYIVYAVVAVLDVLGLLAQLRAAGPDEADEGGAIPCLGVLLLAVVAIGSLIEIGNKRRSPPDHLDRDGRPQESPRRWPHHHLT
jgi:hypothetical protein